MATSRNTENGPSAQLTLFAQEHRVSPTVSPDSERDWMILVATLPSFSLEAWNGIAPAGWFGRTCRVSAVKGRYRVEGYLSTNFRRSSPHCGSYLLKTIKTKGNKMAIQELEKSFKKNGCFLEQVKRTEKTALYAVKGSSTGPTIGYEVWKITIDPPAEVFGKQYPEKEHAPSNEEFGSLAWSWCSLVQAEKCFDELESAPEREAA